MDIEADSSNTANTANTSGGGPEAQPADQTATREQQAIVAGLVLAALLLPGVVRAALLVAAALVSAVVHCPRWVGILLVSAGVPLLLFSAVTGSLWYP